MVREIVVDWTGPGSANKVSVFHFTEDFNVSQQRVALDQFFEAIKSQFKSSFAWNVRTEGRELDDASGGLAGAWADPAVQSGAGTANGEQVPDASQVLVRWTTGVIARGRFLKGRTFLPGLANVNVSNGNLQAAARNTIATAAAGLVSPEVGLAVWSRPQSGSGGSVALVTGSGVWQELAVLRRRRG